jgi:hypothetical protein
MENILEVRNLTKTFQGFYIEQYKFFATQGLHYRLYRA